jgi:hypothetical protein
MSKLKYTEVLSSQKMNDLKGGYLYTCEERKRHMAITCRTDDGKKINDFKIALDDVDDFMTYFNGKKNFKLDEVLAIV